MHALALAIVAVWGTTFVSTKVVLMSGLTPAEIFFIRFAMAAVAMSLCAPQRLWANNWRDELAFIGLGVTGGSAYFLTENLALEYTFCSNVSFIVCSTPLFVALIVPLFYPCERFTCRQWLGCAVALCGLGLVVTNGQLVLHLSPLGDLLALAAAWCWALYTLLFRYVEDRYDSLLITRKTFSWGVLTILPVLAIQGTTPTHLVEAMYNPTVMANLLYLGLIASLACYFLWNVIMTRLGVSVSSRYIFLNPVFTLIASRLVLSEPITPLAVLGGTLILMGIWLGKK